MLRDNRFRLVTLGRLTLVGAGGEEDASLARRRLKLAVLAVLALARRPVSRDTLLGLFAKKATAVMTNVPGPAVPLKICGSTLEQVMFWVPQSGDIGVGVSILSSGGGVQFGLITDARLCPEPQEIIAGFEPEFQRLLLVTLMLPWA